MDTTVLAKIMGYMGHLVEVWLNATIFNRDTGFPITRSWYLAIDMTYKRTLKTL
jgi:hypothetical protein